ncbi:MAG: Flp pilus assembly protein CpaB [Proteobacteria bacterium]|nr:Flp pilus assembly protein CpaB [Pseudomonadota bacterium]
MGNTKTLLISVILTGFAILLGYTYIQQKEAELSRDLGETVDVLVVTKNITEYSPIDEGVVNKKPIPKKFVQPNAVKDIADIKDTVAAVPLAVGETITTNKLLFLGVKTGLAPMISNGKRAIAIRATSLNSVANLIKPGDRIDILAVQAIAENNLTTNKVSTILQDVFVLSAGESVYTQPPRFVPAGKGDFRCVQKIGIDNPTQFNNLTIEVTPKEAQKIVALSGAELFYTLRNPNDRSNDIITSTTDREIFGIEK